MLRKTLKALLWVCGGFVLIAALGFIWLISSIDVPKKRTAAEEGRILDEYAGCLTKDGLKEFVTAANNNDTRHMQALLGTECFPIQGLRFSMVDQGLMNSQIRVYTDEGSVLLWTATKATR